MVAYDKYYQVETLFGEPYPELNDFLTSVNKGKILDLGCGQGRDSIPLARSGFDVTGIDNSKVGIDQMNQVAQKENLSLIGVLGNIFEFDEFEDFDIVLLDNMFHFAKSDRVKETDFVKRIINNVKTHSLIIFCIQDTGNKVRVLNETINNGERTTRKFESDFAYEFEDKGTGHKSKTDYKMIVIEKS